MIFQGFNLLAQRTVLRTCATRWRSPDGRKRSLWSALWSFSPSSVSPTAPSVSLAALRRTKAARCHRPRTGNQSPISAVRRSDSALDPTTTQSILSLLKEINRTMGVTVIVITHEMRVIDQICDRVAVIDRGQIAELGAVSQVFTNPQSKIARELILPGVSIAPVFTPAENESASPSTAKRRGTPSSPVSLWSARPRSTSYPRTSARDRRQNLWADDPGASRRRSERRARPRVAEAGRCLL